MYFSGFSESIPPEFLRPFPLTAPPTHPATAAAVAYRGAVRGAVAPLLSAHHHPSAAAAAAIALPNPLSATAAAGGLHPGLPSPLSMAAATAASLQRLEHAQKSLGKNSNKEISPNLTLKE